MQLNNAFIPYGSYWSTPFVKWQGNFARLHPIMFAAETARRALKERRLDPTTFDSLHLGTTVPSRGVFYGAPWLAGMIGAEHLTGPTVSQACATSARTIAGAVLEVEGGHSQSVLCITADRTSNGPHILYPNPDNPGGRGDAEDWVWDNFNCDPWAGLSMIKTAENVAREEGISTQEQNEVAHLRYSQYQESLKDNAAFHRRYMVTPIEVKDSRGRKVLATVHDDEGVFRTTMEGLQSLKPILSGGTVTFGGQTYPADGNAGLIVSSREKAQDLSRDRGIEVRIVSFGNARVKKGFMPTAVVPAAQAALKAADLNISQAKAIKTHNPFALNDVFFSRKMGIGIDAMNRNGSSLVWGHPQGPTGTRLIIELIEELALAGGGFGVFTGCAAGDTAAAMVLRVS